MSKNSKLQKIESILEQISEIYPEMNRIIIEDPENPSYIMISNEEFLETIMEYFGEEYFEETESPKNSKKKTKLQ